MPDERQKREQQRAREEAQEKLDALAAKARPMENVVLDGGNLVAYFVAKHRVEMEATVVSIPFGKLVRLVGEMMVQIISPMLFRVEVKPDLTDDAPGGKPDLTIS